MDPNKLLRPETGLQARILDVELLETDAKQALTREQPAADALWTALLRPRNEVLAQYRQTLDEMARASVAPDMAHIDPITGQRRDPGPVALLALTNSLVAKSLLGDIAATNIIFERIEGRVAQRTDVVEKDEVERKTQILDVIEETIRALQYRPGDKAKDVTPKPNGSAGNGVDH
jgi:hypothetical protein